MYCEKCGAKLEKDAIFCPKCGNKIKEIEKTLERPNIIKKEVKRPFMKSLSLILRPLSMILISLSIIALSYYGMDMLEIKKSPDSEWGTEHIYGLCGFEHSPKYCSDYEEYKEKVWEREYSSTHIEILLPTGIILLIISFVAYKSYKIGQEDE